MTTPNYTGGLGTDTITNVCTNFKELIASDDFIRVINISLRSTDFNHGAILKYFQVLKDGKGLADREKANLKSFLENENMRKAAVGLLNKFSESSLPATASLNQSKLYNVFLEELFSENGFDKAVLGISKIAEIDLVKTGVYEALNYSEDVQTRREAWSELSKALEVDVSKVNITNNGINIDGVANFELDDSEDASYEELARGEKGGLTGIPYSEIWLKLYHFIGKWSKEQKQVFISQIMGMKITNKIGEKMKYISQTKDSDKMVQRLTVTSNGLYCKSRSYIDTSLFVRRVKSS